MSTPNEEARKKIPLLSHHGSVLERSSGVSAPTAVSDNRGGGSGQRRKIPPLTEMIESSERGRLDRDADKKDKNGRDRDRNREKEREADSFPLGLRNDATLPGRVVERPLNLRGFPTGGEIETTHASSKARDSDAMVTHGRGTKEPLDSDLLGLHVPAPSNAMREAISPPPATRTPNLLVASGSAGIVSSDEDKACAKSPNPKKPKLDGEDRSTGIVDVTDADMTNVEPLPLPGFGGRCVSAMNPTLETYDLTDGDTEVEEDLRTDKKDKQELSEDIKDELGMANMGPAEKAALAAAMAAGAPPAEQGSLPPIGEQAPHSPTKEQSGNSTDAGPPSY